MRLFWFIYIILVSPLKEFIKIYNVKNPVLNSANYDRCMPTRPPVDPRTHGISKQTSPYCLNLEHAKLQNGMIIYGQSFYLSYNASFESVFFQANTFSSFIWLYDFFFSLEFVIKVILKHTIKKWHIHLRLLDQTKSCCTFLNKKTPPDFMIY